MARQTGAWGPSLSKLSAAPWPCKPARTGTEAGPAALRAARQSRLRAALAALLALLALAACTAPQGLVLRERPGALEDDGSALALSRAIAGSIAYYSRVAPGTVYRYGELSYTPAEMIASLQLFQREFLAAADSADLGRRLLAKFHVFESIREGGANLFTGYYEPELQASDTPTEHLSTPLYALPLDMVKIRLQRFGDHLPPLTLTGRLEDGELVPYYSRREIQSDGAVDATAEPIAYVNEVDLFFLQIQGSGVLRFADGRRVSVGYAASNGHPYRSIGSILVRRKAMELEDVSLQSIRAWLADNPEHRRGLLFANPSYVFFRVRDEGPLGNIRVELTPRRSLAADQRFVPAGSLVHVTTEAPVPGQPEAVMPVRRFMLVQDTGGAIRGHGRGDLFWGAGADAEWIAGHQRHDGRLLLLVARKEALAAATAGN